MSNYGHCQRITVTFSGKSEDYVKYRIQLRAGLGMEGLAEAFDESFDSRLPTKESDVLNEDGNGDKAKIKAKEINAKAMNMIVMGQQSNTMMNAIELTKTTDWPSVKAWEVFKELET